MTKRSKNSAPASALSWKSADAWLTKSDRRRLSILEATLDCIASEKLEPLTLDLVGRKCGVRRSHIAYYFKDANALILAAISYAVSLAQDTIVRALAEANTPEERLACLVRANVEWFFLNQRFAATGALLHYYGACNAEYRKLHTKLSSAGQDRFASVLLAKTSSRASDKKQAQALAKQIRAFLLGSIFTFINTEPRPPVETEIKRLTKEVAAMTKAMWK